MGNRIPACAMTRDDEPGHANSDFLGADCPAGSFDAMTHAVFDLEPGDLAVLDDVDAATVGTTGIPPGYRVVAHRAATRLPERALDREPRVVEIEERTHLLDAVAVQEFRISPRKAHGIGPAGKGITLWVRVDQVENAALGDHRVVVEILLEAFPEFQGQLVERLVAFQQIVRADDRCVAANIAAADPAFFEHSDVRDAELFGQVMRGCQPMSAAANDNHIVFRLGVGLAPNWLPAFVSGQTFFEDFESRIAHCILIQLVQY